MEIVFVLSLFLMMCKGEEKKRSGGVKEEIMPAHIIPPPGTAKDHSITTACHIIPRPRPFAKNKRVE